MKGLRSARLTVLLAASLSSTLAFASPPEDRIVSTCRLVESAAAANRLPVDFLTRLLWTESRFRSEVTSPKGAEGVAQFMPQTAAERGLADPRDPAQAIAHAARLLVDLDRQFGNLGLAAAAYNAGAARVAKWLRSGGSLPSETRLYVEAVTGYRVEAWVGAGNFPVPAAESGSCDALVALLVRRYRETPAAAARVLQTKLDGGLSSAIALLASVPAAAHGRPIPAATRRGAEDVCADVRSLGMPCAVYGR